MNRLLESFVEYGHTPIGPVKYAEECGVIDFRSMERETLLLGNSKIVEPGFVGQYQRRREEESETHQTNTLRRTTSKFEREDERFLDGGVLFF